MCSDGARQESDLYRKLFSLLVKREKQIFFKSDGEGVGSTVTAGREGPDLALFQERTGRLNCDCFVLVEFIS